MIHYCNLHGEGSKIGSLDEVREEKVGAPGGLHPSPFPLLGSSSLGFCTIFRYRRIYQLCHFPTGMLIHHSFIGVFTHQPATLASL